MRRLVGLLGVAALAVGGYALAQPSSVTVFDSASTIGLKSLGLPTFLGCINSQDAGPQTNYTTSIPFSTGGLNGKTLLLSPVAGAGAILPSTTDGGTCGFGRTNKGVPLASQERVVVSGIMYPYLCWVPGTWSSNPATDDPDGGLCVWELVR